MGKFTSSRKISKTVTSSKKSIFEKLNPDLRSQLTSYQDLNFCYIFFWAGLSVLATPLLM
jgi:hypothetical protein